LVGNKQEVVLHGAIKSSPDDFIVEERPLYEPCGEGEHLYVTVRKTNMSHDELVRKIAKEFGVPNRSVGTAGRKDLRAVTTQVVSVHLPGKQLIAPETIGSVEVLSSSWHTNKLRLGHLLGNHFSILIRQVKEHAFKLIEDRLDVLKKTGLPNAFGPQRFGNSGNNHSLGLAIILGDWDAVVSTLLQGEDRHNEFATDGAFQKALDAWPFGQPAARNVLQALSQGKTAQQACKTIHKQVRKLWVNAFQSALFNKVLHQRQRDETWDTILDGDLVWNKEGGGRTFEITAEEVESSDILERVRSFAIAPSGPLWGAKMRLPSEQVLELEQSVLVSFGVNEVHLANMKKIAKGARRPLRVQVENPIASTGSDSIGEYVKIEFDLPAGSYATVVIQYLLTGEV